jgi:hypothetical protein
MAKTAPTRAIAAAAPTIVRYMRFTLLKCACVIGHFPPFEYGFVPPRKKPTTPYTQALRKVYGALTVC